jgi:hypothetical protein
MSADIPDDSFISEFRLREHDREDARLWVGATAELRPEEWGCYASS